jgi:hypothetical protein
MRQVIAMLGIFAGLLTMADCGGEGVNGSTAPASPSPTSKPTEVQEITFEELFSRPGQYNGMNIRLEGFFFHGFETIVMSEDWEYTGSADGHIWTLGQKIWVEGSIPRDIYEQLHKHAVMLGPTEHYGMLRIEGMVEYGDNYGHVGSLTSQIVPSGVELITWSPPPEQPELTIAGLKYRLIGYFGGVLVGEPVGFPDNVRIDQARRAFATIQQNEEEFAAILDQLDLEPESVFSYEQQLLIFEEKLQLNAARLEQSESGYSFALMATEKGEPFEIEGTVGRDGEVIVLEQRRAILPR